MVELGLPPGSPIVSKVVGRNQSGQLEVFAVNSTGQVVHIAQTSPNNGWGTWTSLGPTGNNLGPLAVGINDNGRQEVFAVSKLTGEILHIAQTSPNNGWGTWTSLGRPTLNDSVRGLAVGMNADGRQEVLANGSFALWDIWQTSPSNGWSGWASHDYFVPALAQQIMIAVGRKRDWRGSNQDGRLEAFLVADDRALWDIWQTSPNNGWSSWTTLGSPSASALVNFQTPAVGSNQDGRLEVFAAGTDGALWHIWQTSPNNGWSGWDSFGGEAITSAVVGQNEDGRLEVFVVE